MFKIWYEIQKFENPLIHQKSRNSLHVTHHIIFLFDAETVMWPPNADVNVDADADIEIRMMLMLMMMSQKYFPNHY